MLSMNFSFLSLLIFFILQSGYITVGHPAQLYDADHHHPRPSYSLKSDTSKNSVDWNKIARDDLIAIQSISPQLGSAKNVIFFLGDGLGMSTVTAARYLLSEQNNVHISEAAFAFEQFPSMGLAKTYNSDRKVPDSAGTATAMLCGEKVNFYTLGVNDKVLMSGCNNVADNKLRSAIKYAMDADKWTGVVTNTRITHASPAAAYASTADRNWEAHVPDDVQDRDQCPDIAHQLIQDKDNSNIKVLLGGGRRNFYPNNVTIGGSEGERQDNRDLIKEWLQLKSEDGLSDSKYKYVSTREEFETVHADEVEYLLGLFTSSHMSYELDRIKESPPKEPSLTEMVQKAINILQKGPDGYFLYVEGGRIDTAHHDTQPHLALSEVLSFNEAVLKAYSMVDTKDTLLLVTADHSHVMSIAGYPKTEDSILGTHLDMTWEPADKIPYSIVGYLNGPGWYRHRVDDNGQPININVSWIETPITRKNITDIDTTAEHYVSDAGIPNDSETHAGEDVPIYAVGPSSYIFNGVHEQHYIAHAMMYIACIGPYSDNCATSGINVREPSVHLYWPIILAVVIKTFKPIFPKKHVTCCELQDIIQ